MVKIKKLMIRCSMYWSFIQLRAFTITERHVKQLSNIINHSTRVWSLTAQVYTIYSLHFPSQTPSFGYFQQSVIPEHNRSRSVRLHNSSCPLEEQLESRYRGYWHQLDQPRDFMLYIISSILHNSHFECFKSRLISYPLAYFCILQKTYKAHR